MNENAPRSLAQAAPWNRADFGLPEPRAEKLQSPPECVRTRACNNATSGDRKCASICRTSHPADRYSQHNSLWISTSFQCRPTLRAAALSICTAVPDHSVLQFPADQQIEFLICSAEFEIGLQCHRVIALQQRIQKLVERERRICLISALKVFALKHAGNRVMRSELNQAFCAKRCPPFTVVANLGFSRVQNPRGLCKIRLRIRADLLA